MDTARLPAYRSSYLLRFHPYPRMKLSARERIASSAQEGPSYGLLDFLYSERDASLAANQAARRSDAHIQLHQGYLNASSLVVDLALLDAKVHLQDD